jgi:flagellar biosynthetic protein FliO
VTGYYLRDYSEIANAPASAPWWSMTFDLIVKLGLVIGLIYLTMWALRTYVLGPQARRRLNARLTGRMDVLDTTQLAPNRTLYLVEVADRVLVLGATGTSLNTLAEIREPEAIDLLKKPAQADVGQPEAPNFAAHFKALTEQPLGDRITSLKTLAAGLRR